VPGAVPVSNPGGKTLVTNAGSNGKFLGVMDMDYKGKKLREFKYRLLPIFSNLLPADAEMTAYIEKVRKPHLAKLQQELSVAEDVLFRRGNFNGTFDQVICDALRVEGCPDFPVARFSLGYHRVAGPGYHDGTRHGPDLYYLSRNLCA
jgi:sulfur-oxidizing protein SoxB